MKILLLSFVLILSSVQAEDHCFVEAEITDPWGSHHIPLREYLEGRPSASFSDIGQGFSDPERGSFRLSRLNDEELFIEGSLRDAYSSGELGFSEVISIKQSRAGKTISAPMIYIERSAAYDQLAREIEALNQELASLAREDRRNARRLKKVNKLLEKKRLAISRIHRPAIFSLRLSCL